MNYSTNENNTTHKIHQSHRVGIALTRQGKLSSTKLLMQLSVDLRELCRRLTAYFIALNWLLKTSFCLSIGSWFLSSGYQLSGQIFWIIPLWFSGACTYFFPNH